MASPLVGKVWALLTRWKLTHWSLSRCAAWAATFLVTLLVVLSVIQLVCLFVGADFGSPPPLPLDDASLHPSELTAASGPACLTDIGRLPPTESAYCKKLCGALPAGRTIGTKMAATPGTAPNGKAFAHFTMYKTEFRGRDLTRADFRCAKLQGVSFTASDLGEADFTCANITDLQIHSDPASGRVNALQMRFDYVSVGHGEVSDVDFNGADFSCSRLHSVDITSSSLDATILRATNIEGGSLKDTTMNDVTLAHTVFAPSDLPKDVTTLDRRDWRTILVSDLRIAESPKGLVTSLSQMPAEFNDAVIRLRDLAKKLREQHQEEAAEGLSHRVEQMKLLWMDQPSSGSFWMPIHLNALYWVRWLADFLTSNGTDRVRLAQWLFSIWGLGTMYFSCRLFRLARSTKDTIFVERQPQQPATVGQLDSLRPFPSLRIPWAAFIAMGVLMAFLLAQLGKQIPLPTSMTSVAARIGAIKTTGVDFYARLVIELTGWMLFALWIGLTWTGLFG